jgi:hypothetical protein
MRVATRDKDQISLLELIFEIVDCFDRVVGILAARLRRLVSLSDSLEAIAT